MANFSLTITGADDGVDALALAELAEAYPFVELAILFSADRQGRPRYPSQEWREEFYDVTCDRSDSGYNTAAHLCGKLVQGRLATVGMFETEIEKNFDTIQFNLFTPNLAPYILDYSKRYQKTHQVVVPFNNNTKPILTSKDAEYWSTLSVLCDSSGGRGVACKAWPDDVPQHFYDRQAVGFAGGINEQNIEAVLEGLGQMYGDKFFWIDLETGARDADDAFDLDTVERILELAADFIEYDLPGLEDEIVDDETSEIGDISENLPQLIIIN
ncbi:hypothetical protein D3C87_279370 [compost metagenome]